MGVNACYTKRYDDKRIFRQRENKANQSQSPGFGRKSENKRNESSHSIFKEYDLKKQTQFGKTENERNVNYNKGLR
jgi:hypothetical protein